MVLFEKDYSCRHAVQIRVKYIRFSGFLDKESRKNGFIFYVDKNPDRLADGTISYS